MGRPPPPLVSQQDPIRIDLVVERGQKRRTCPRRETPGIMRRVKQMRADPAAQSPLGGATAGGPPSRHRRARVHSSHSRRSCFDSARSSGAAGPTQ